MRRGGRKRAKRVRVKPPRLPGPNAAALEALERDASTSQQRVEFPTTSFKYSISFTSLTDADVAEIARALKAAPHVVKLQLKEDGILRLNGLSALMDVVRVHPNLRTLDLSDNYIGAEGGVVIAKALEKNTTLARLDLSDNFTGDDGCVAFTKTLKVNKTLLYLSLSGNQIGMKGAKVLAEGLRVNRSLKMLSLMNNPLSDRGMAKILEAMETNFALTRLQVTPYRFKGEAELNRLLSRNNARQGEAFALAQGGPGKIPWRRGKLMVVGEGGVGKTACVRSLLNQPFDPEWKSTIGVSMAETRTTENGWKKVNNSHFALDLLHKLAVRALATREEANDEEGKDDEAKDDEEEDDEDALGGTQTPTSNSQTVSSGTEDSGLHITLPIAAGEHEVGMDAEDSLEEAYAFNEHLLVTAKQEKLALSVWDYGGQRVFYTLHHVFLTNYGMYLLVFDGRKLEVGDADAHSMDFIKFWLNSIKLHAPEAPVLLVATFSEELKDVNALNTSVEAVIEKFSQVVRPSSESICFFPVDNRVGSGFETLKETVEQTMSAQAYFNFEVSVVWMRALDAIRAEKKSWLTIDSVWKKVNELGVSSKQEVEEMLNMFHELGIVLYFTATEELRTLVITDPQWLADSISQVIRDRELHPFNADKLARSGLRKDAQSLLENALVTRDLLDFVWEKGTVNFLIDLMRSLLLISDWAFSQAEKAFLVPSMIEDAAPLDRQLDGRILEFSFEFLPDGVFERVVCLCVECSAGWKDTAQPRLFKDLCFVNLEDAVKVAMVRNRDRSTIEIYSTSTPEKLHARLLSMLRAMMAKVRDEVMGGVRFQFALKLSSEDGMGMVAYEDAKETQLSPWFDSEETLGESPLAKRLNKFVL